MLASCAYQRLYLTIEDDGGGVGHYMKRRLMFGLQVEVGTGET
jgi:hypothetical protein